MAGCLFLCDLSRKCGNLHQDTLRILLLSESNVQKSLVICTHDIPTLFNIGGTHLYALMGHVDGHFVVFLYRNSYIPRTNKKYCTFFRFFLISSFLLKLKLCSFLNQVHVHRLNTKKHENLMVHFALNRPYTLNVFFLSSFFLKKIGRISGKLYKQAVCAAS